MPLTSEVPVAVVGDTAFEAVRVREACARRNRQGIVPMNPERELTGATAEQRPRVPSSVGHPKAEDFQKASFGLGLSEFVRRAEGRAGRRRLNAIL